MSPDLIEALARIVGPRWVRHRRAELATYTMDGLPTRESYPGVSETGEREPVVVVETHAAALDADVLDETGLHDRDGVEVGETAPLLR